MVALHPHHLHLLMTPMKLLVAGCCYQQPPGRQPQKHLWHAVVTAPAAEGRRGLPAVA
jgi:hypothetical protein